eukprot:1324173-Amorphochlora_amoeboformis.AAC.1
MFEFALLNKMTVISRRKAQFLKTPDSSSKRAISAPAGPTGTSIRGEFFICVHSMCVYTIVTIRQVLLFGAPGM